MWSVPILFAGKYRPYIHNGFKCRRDYFSGPFFYSHPVSRIFEARRKAAGKFVAMLGIGLISFNAASLQLNPIGDLLALLAAFLWACYSILTRKISSFGYNTILTTRRVFFYGILFMIPALFLFDFKLDLSRFANMTYLLNILFLGLGASALCFVTWNFAVKILGAVKTSIYIYLVPVITVAASVLIIHELFTWITGIGTVLTLAGLLVSEKKHMRKEVESNGFTQ